MKNNDSVTWFAVLMFVVVLVTHYAPSAASHLWANPERAAKALFYILRGAEGAILFVFLAALLPSNQSAAISICWWGVIEESQTSICRMAYGLDSYPPPGPALCDTLTGLPIYLATLCTVAASIYRNTRGGR